MTAKKQLPSLAELYANPELVYDQNQLNIILNADPPKEYIRDHPLAAGVKYIPVGIVENLLTRIFIKWRLEIRDSKVIANAVQVTVRLHVQDPISGDWDWQDGIGAAPIQTRKGASATDFTQVLNDAVVKAAPAAESYALKDAAEKLGRLFGKDLNRKEFMPYVLEGRIDLDVVECSPDQVSELYELLKQATLTHDEVDDYREKFSGLISVSAYNLYRRELIDRQVSAVDRVRNGENVSQGDIKKAVKQLL